MSIQRLSFASLNPFNSSRVINRPVMRFGSSHDDDGADSFQGIGKAPADSPRLPLPKRPDTEGMSKDDATYALWRYEVNTMYANKFNAVFSDKGSFPSRDLQKQLVERIRTTTDDMEEVLERDLTLEEHGRLFDRILAEYEPKVLLSELTAICLEQYVARMKDNPEVSDILGEKLGGSSYRFDGEGYAEALKDKAREVLDFEHAFEGQYISATRRNELLTNIVCAHFDELIAAHNTDDGDQK